MREFRFGVIACVVTVMCVVTAGAQTFTVLHRFGFKTDGQRPTGGLTWGPGDTVLFGTTTVGGTYNAGTVFQISPSGRETVLYSFGAGADAVLPAATLARGPGGTLYGTSEAGGEFKRGTVFKLAKVGNTVQETVVYSFQGGTDGYNPESGLVWDSAGNLYGTTGNGGGGTACYLGCGTVFKIDATTGQETVLYAFQGSPDGANPPRGLVRDSAGNLYGTTTSGGASNNGTVFMLSPSGQETILHSFTGAPDGAGPWDGLLRDAEGNLFGTTSEGGTGTNFECAGVGCGTVFEVTSSGVESVLYSFSGAINDDEGFPWGGLVEDSAGNLYGTTGGEGSGNSACVTNGGCGTIFKLDPAGTLTTLHNFSFSDGAWPWPTLTMDPSGNLYGTTIDGGLKIGTVFKLTP